MARSYRICPGTGGSPDRDAALRWICPFCGRVDIPLGYAGTILCHYADALIDGYPEPQPFTDEQIAAHLENAHIDGCPPSEVGQ